MSSDEFGIVRITALLLSDGGIGRFSEGLMDTFGQNLRRVRESVVIGPVLVSARLFVGRAEENGPLRYLNHTTGCAGDSGSLHQSVDDGDIIFTTLFAVSRNTKVWKFWE